MPEVPVGAAGGSGGGFPIPPRFLIIGGGALVVMFLLYRAKGGGGQSGDVVTGDAVYGSSLGPNAALALGGLQNQLMSESGALQELFTQQAQALGDQNETQYNTLLDAIFGVGEQAADFDFWQTAQRRGELMNVRAQNEGWDANRWAGEMQVYAKQMISMRPDLTEYFRGNYEESFGDILPWSSTQPQLSGG